MSSLIRALIYVSLIVVVVLFFLPGQFLEWAGVVRPREPGIQQALGVVAAVLGLSLVIWCVLAFAVVGHGTPLPFDPPRRLVVEGPYRFVRNPMALGVGSALAGVALFYESWRLAAVAGVFFLIIHLFVVLYEEPTLRRMFGGEYVSYCKAVKRWLPRWKVYGS